MEPLLLLLAVPLVGIGGAAALIYAVEPDYHRAKFVAHGFHFDSYRIDKGTGFPVVPEGWLWSVYMLDAGGEYERLGIALYDNAGNNHGSRDFYTSIYRRHRLTLRIDANKILRRMRERNRPDLNASKWVGSYPPKSLRGGR